MYVPFTTVLLLFKIRSSILIEKNWVLNAIIKFSDITKIFKTVELWDVMPEHSNYHFKTLNIILTIEYSGVVVGVFFLECSAQSIVFGREPE